MCMHLHWELGNRSQFAILIFQHYPHTCFHRSMDHEEPQASAPIELTFHGECPHCSNPYETFPAPLLRYAAHVENSEWFDWNLYYWGTDNWLDQPAERKTIRCPLPRSITNRIPLELYEHIIHFLRGHRRPLYFCTLVCVAWYHLAQRPLYTSVMIYRQVHLDTLVYKQRSLHNLTTRHVSAWPMASERSMSPFLKTLPIAASNGLAHQLQCISLTYFQAPYNRNIAMFMSRFSQLSHLKLVNFRLYSSEDLRRIICALPSLLDLSLLGGDIVSETIASHDGGSTFTPRNHPFLRKISLGQMGRNIIIPFSRWIASTPVFSTCTILAIMTDPRDCVTWIRPILQKLGGTIVSLRCDYDEDISNIGM